MSVGDYLRNLFGDDDKAKPNHTGHRKTAATPGNASDDVLLRRLDRILWQRRSILSGNIHLVGLQKIRNRIGDEWPRIAERAQDIAQKAIQRACGAEDVFTRYDELSFLIIFANLSTEQAQLRCLEIAEEIGRKLLGDNFVAEAAEVSSGVFEADGSLVFNAISKPDLIQRLIAEKEKKLDAAPGGEVAEQSATADENGDADPGMPDFSFAQLDKTKALASIRIQYRPMWNLKQKVIANYFAAATGENLFGRRISDSALREELASALSNAEFDMFVARSALRDLAVGVTKGNRVLMSWPIHFETLAARTGREAYIALCREIPDQVRQLLVFELDGLPDGVPQSRLLDIMAALKPFCRGIMVRVPADFHNFSVMTGLGLTGVGFSLSGYAPGDEQRIKLMNDFVDHATRIGLRCYVHGIASRAQALAAIAAGFDWIDGDPVNQAADLPGPMIRFNIDDLYRPV